MRAILSALLLFCSFALFPNGAGAEQGRVLNADSAHLLSIVRQKDGARYDFKIDLALTKPQQAYGLMNRTSLPPDYGMLFYFGDEVERAFWMKDTLVPLDMIFIKKDGTIGHIHENAKPNDLTSIPSEGPAQAVLEVPGGTASSLGLKKGDRVHHLVFGNSLAM